MNEVQLLDIFKKLVIKQQLYCDEGIHTGEFRIGFDTLYVLPDELSILEAFLRNDT